jgi:hypothetical protein
MTSIALELPTGCQLFGSHVTHTHKIMNIRVFINCAGWLLSRIQSSEFRLIARSRFPAASSTGLARSRASRFYNLI